MDGWMHGGDGAGMFNLGHHWNVHVSYPDGMCLVCYCCRAVGTNNNKKSTQSFVAGQACLQEVGRDLLFPSTSERLVPKGKPLKANCSVCLGIKMGFLGALSQMTAFLFLCTNCHNCMPFCPSKKNTTVILWLCVSYHRLVPLQL